MTERLSNALNIVKYALENNISVNESCRKHNKTTSYVRTAKDDYLDRNNPEFKSFLELYKQAIANPNVKKVHKVVYATDDTTVEDEQLDNNLLTGKDQDPIDEDQIIQNKTDRTLEIDFRGKKLIRSAEDLLKEAKVDMNVWKLDKKVVNKWDVTMRDNNGEPITGQNFQVKVWLSRIRSEEEQNAWDNFLAAIRENAPKQTYSQGYNAKNFSDQSSRRYMLEVSIPDLHIGKLAWEDESGENYDTKIAIQRFNECVDNLLLHVYPYRNQIEEILLPIGNDLINIDNMSNKTTAGTDQRVDSRWQQMFQKAKEVTIENINKLSKIAPVKVAMVSGNHDYQTVYYLGCVLEAYYSKSNNVKIDNSAEQRKYHEYGVNMVGFTHGNEEKHQELGLIMATQKPEMWARTKCRQIHLGHFHSRRTTKYLDVQEFQGFTVRILPSLSGTDDWHNRKGYMSMKSGVAFLYEKAGGLVAEFSHNFI